MFKTFLPGLLALVSAVFLHALPSFPGAEGWGADNPGGRGGTVFHVTNLNDNGQGSFRNAVAGGNRIVVFDAAGVIEITSTVWITGSNITIAGETAPGAGITLHSTVQGGLMADGQSNLIIRFLRIRGNPDGTQGDGVRMFDCRNVITDHVSSAWSEDENYDLSNSVDITVQWGIVNETIRGMAWFHNYGSSQRFCLHHNLSTHNAIRNPIINSDSVDMRNNVIYDFDLALHFQLPPHEPHNLPLPHKINVIGNFFKKLVTNSTDRPIPIEDSLKEIYYISDNYYTKSTYKTDNQTLIATFTSWKSLPAPLALKIPVTTDPVQLAYQKVVSWAGCWPRDSLDRRNVKETITATGTRTPDLNTPLMAGLAPRPHSPDADNDGSPDWFEDSVGTLKATADDKLDKDSDGYTNVEEFLHYCAFRLIGNLSILSGTALEKPASAGRTLTGLRAVGTPFTGTVTLLAGHENGGAVQPAVLQIISPSGKTVKTWRLSLDGRGSSQEIIWNGRDARDRPAAAGVYLVRLLINGAPAGQEKLVLLR